jgi:hypothetical protein
MARVHVAVPATLRVFAAVLVLMFVSMSEQVLVQVLVLVRDQRRGLLLLQALGSLLRQGPCCCKGKRGEAQWRDTIMQSSNSFCGVKAAATGQRRNAVPGTGPGFSFVEQWL